MPDGQAVHVTVSVGVVGVTAGRNSETKSLIAAADRQLYEAKRAGRNCVVIEPAAVTGVSASEKSALLSEIKQAKDE